MYRIHNWWTFPPWYKLYPVVRSRARPTETNVERATSQRKSGTSLNLRSSSGNPTAAHTPRPIRCVLPPALYPQHATPCVLPSTCYTLRSTLIFLPPALYPQLNPAASVAHPQTRTPNSKTLNPGPKTGQPIVPDHCSVRARAGDPRRGTPSNPPPYTLHPAFCTLHPTPCTLHSAPYTLHPTPCILHPTPYALHPTPCILHPTPCTLHPAPCTLHSTLYTLHPTP
ncbi:hypothetical protein T484DRAFT_1625655 [Baffinella frigidus]|nr:hypothetical protein T484DRAFT_1625655 [Cryptophyta sp. CCMP2293]